MATPEEPSRPDGRSRPTVSLGNPGEFTILELAKKVIHLTGLRSRIIFQPLPQDGPLQHKPDIPPVAEKLEWVPAVNLEEGLRRFIAYFKTIVRS